ncbi:MAG: hypothetical protein KC620_19510, partial [Myxococcales bacterium]|nr:hypothetical protein [Myxococcales bacterium]
MSGVLGAHAARWGLLICGLLTIACDPAPETVADGGAAADDAALGAVVDAAPPDSRQGDAAV